MGQKMMVAVVGILALSIGGCGLFGGGDDVADQPSPVPSIARKAKPATPFASKPLVSQQPSIAAAPSGLLQSTNPDVRVRQVQKGRKDPFSVLPVRPIVTVSPPPPGSVPVPVPRLPQIPTPTGSNPGGGRSPTTPRRNVLPRPPQSPIASRPTTTNRPGTTANRPGTTSNRPGGTPLSPLAKRPNFTPSLPKLPDPTLARGVEVTGVVEVGGVPQALVKAPNEPYSRYIKAGQRISNGQVLVKRIEMNGGTPTVILEQYGIEVAKRVGEKPAGATLGTEGAPTAVLPVNRLSFPQA